MSDALDAANYVDEYTEKTNARLSKSLASTEARQKTTPIGKADANMKSTFVPGATSDLNDTALSNVDPADVAHAVNTVGTQLVNSATKRIDQTPNNPTASAFSFLSPTDAISGSSSSTTLTGGGAMGQSNPLVGGGFVGALSSFSIPTVPDIGASIGSSIGGIAGPLVGSVLSQVQAQALSRVEDALNSAVGFNIRQTVTDVQGAAITMVAVATTAVPDIAMELIANNARSILTELDKKDKIVDQISAEITVLNNLVVTIFGAQPDMQKYINELITAYNLILSADLNLKSVASTLSRQGTLNTRLYNSSVASLVQAKALILPKGIGPPVRTSEFLSAILTRSTSKEALAALLAIPGAIQKVATLMIQYTKEVVIINGLIFLFLKALASFINSYKGSPAITQSSLDHLNAAIKQLDALLADMKAELFPTDGRNKDTSYQTKVVTAAGGWGIRLSTTISWLQTNPSAQGTAILSKTAANVLAYNTAVAALNNLNNRKYGLSTLSVSHAQENVLDTAKQIGKLMIVAATSVVPTDTKQNIQAKFKQALDLMQNTKLLSTDIRNALKPFTLAQSALSADIAAVTSSLTKVFTDLGLGRAADLFKKADFTSFFKLTPAFATYAGAAAGGIGLLMKQMSTSTSLTDQDYGKLSNMKDNFDRTADVDLTESVRSFGAQESLFTAQIQETITNQSTLATSVKSIANRFDPTVVTEDPTATIISYADKAIGNKFNFGAA